MKCSALLILFAALLAGCTLPVRPPVELQTKFDKVEHDSYKQPGTGAIVGQGFLRQRGGGVVTCAGSPVLLMPATSFFLEAIGHLRNGHQIAVSDKIDPSYKSIIKQSQCDAQGNFSFSLLSAGAWFVTTDVKWGGGQYMTVQGGTLMREVTVVNDQPIQVLLSDNDRL